MNEVVNAYFDERKHQCLTSCDSSRKGSIDEPIKELIGRINAHPHFYTTSSCSGRVIVFVNRDSDDSNDNSTKNHLDWLLNSHVTITKQQITSLIDGFSLLSDSNDNGRRLAILKFEPFILHIQCRNLLAGKQLQDIAIQCGFRNSGITFSKSNRINLAIRSTLALELPILGCGCRALVDDSYFILLEMLLREKFNRNQLLIDRFCKEFYSKFGV